MNWLSDDGNFPSLIPLTKGVGGTVFISMNNLC
jgi:hypothetical protein